MCHVDKSAPLEKIEKTPGGGEGGAKTADQKGPRAVDGNGARRKTIAPMKRLLQIRYNLLGHILEIPRLEGTAGPKEGQNLVEIAKISLGGDTSLGLPRGRSSPHGATPWKTIFKGCARSGPRTGTKTNLNKSYFCVSKTIFNVFLSATSAEKYENKKKNDKM